MHVEIPPCPTPGYEGEVWAIIDYCTKIDMILAVRLVNGWADAVRLVVSEYREECRDEGLDCDEADALRQLTGRGFLHGQFRTFLEVPAAYGPNFEDLPIKIGKRRRPKAPPAPAWTGPVPKPSAN
jgi:hypothetical protein